MRLLSVFLAVLMVCFSFPLSVFADFTADQEVNEAAKTQKVQDNVNYKDVVTTSVVGGVTSIAGSVIAGKYTSSISQCAKSQKEIAKTYMSKAMARMDAGKSSSAIIRQTIKHVKDLLGQIR